MGANIPELSSLNICYIPETSIEMDFDFVTGGDDPSNGDGAEEEEGGEGELLHPPARDLHPKSCSMNHLLPMKTRPSF